MIPTLVGVIVLQRSQRDTSLPVIERVPYPRLITHGSNVLKFLLELRKPLGAAGEHATAGRYVAMLRSSSEFNHSFTQVPLLTTGQTSTCDIVTELLGYIS